MDDIGKATVDLVRLLSSPLKEKLATMETRAIAAEAERDALREELRKLKQRNESWRKRWLTSE